MKLLPLLLALALVASSQASEPAEWNSWHTEVTKTNMPHLFRHRSGPQTDGGDLCLVEFQNLSYQTLQISASLFDSDTGEVVYTTDPMALPPSATGVASYEASKGAWQWKFHVTILNQGPRQ
jgi:hypothetical protein